MLIEILVQDAMIRELKWCGRLKGANAEIGRFFEVQARVSCFAYLFFQDFFFLFFDWGA